jgi:hypothetical protein
MIIVRLITTNKFAIKEPVSFSYLSEGALF